MNKPFKSNLFLTASLYLIFIIYTVSVKFVDVALIGNKLSSVGFSSLNEVFFNLFSKTKTDGLFVDNTFQMICYNISEILGYFALLVAAFFVLVGVIQLLNYRSLKKVNKNIYVLGGFYVLVMAFYVLFEKVVINYRPVYEMNSEVLEASYPSSHTILTLCILLSAVLVIPYIYSNINKRLYTVITILFYIIMVITVMTRLMSGVHWFTDILGGILLSAALIMSFKTFINKINQ